MQIKVLAVFAKRTILPFAGKNCPISISLLFLADSAEAAYRKKKKQREKKEFEESQIPFIFLHAALSRMKAAPLYASLDFPYYYKTGLNKTLLRSV